MNQTNTYIKDLISKMDLDQKVGAILTLGFTGTMVRQHIYNDIFKYHCGGLRLTPNARTFGSYIDPKTGKTIVSLTDTKGYKKGVNAPYVTADGYRNILMDLQEKAMSRPLGIPLHFSFDQEGGTSANFWFDGINIFPKPMGIRASGDPNMAYEIAKAVSRQTRAIGFNWIHSPVLDVNTDPDNPEIYTRAYSDDAEIVAEYALKACLGFKEGGLIATGKHFPGRGDSSVDAHFEMPVINVSKDVMLKRELLPYKVLIEHDALPSIMIAHSIYPAIDGEHIATVSKKILTGLLRDELGFDGVITTDSMTMGGVAVRYGVANACAMSVEAGADLVLMKAEGALVGETFEAVKNLITSGRVSEDELNEKVYRVLNLKYEYGLFNQGSLWHELPNEAINDEKIIALSKLAAKRSTMVLKNEQEVLPLSRDEKILVIEQISKTPNDIHWHPGLLFEKVSKYSGNAEYLEVSYTYDECDKEAIKANISKFDTVIVTNFYNRGTISNNEFLSELIKDSEKRFIVVTNTPYRLSVPDGARNVILTFSTAPDNIEVTAGVLFGEINADGQCPIS